MQNQQPKDESTEPAERTGKTKVVKIAFVFQLKLMADGLRDLFLSPISIIAALAGIILSPSKPDRFLRQLMYFGRKTDRWINLFGAFGQYSDPRKTTSDAYLQKVEEMLVKDYQEGGVARMVKNGTGKLVETAQNEVEAVRSAVKKVPKKEQE